MAAQAVTHREHSCSVEVAPSQVDAGAELTVIVQAHCPHGCDLTGQAVSIRSEDGAELATGELGDFALQAPLEVGAHIWRAVLAMHETNGIRHAEAATEFTVVVVPHAASVNIWGLPSAIAAGGRFGFKVGIKCSAGCTLAGRPLGVLDH